MRCATASTRRTARRSRRSLSTSWYGDFEGGQRSITRFSLFPSDDGWLAGVVRHWRVDAPNPRHADLHCTLTR